MTQELLIVLMVLTTYRLTRFVTKDTMPPILWLRDRVAGGWRPVQDNEDPEDDCVVVIDGSPHLYVVRKAWSPYWLAELMSCPWCASGWLSLGIVAATAATVGIAAPVLVWPAVWGLGALLAAQRWS